MRGNQVVDNSRGDWPNNAGGGETAAKIPVPGTLAEVISQPPVSQPLNQLKQPQAATSQATPPTPTVLATPLSEFLPEKTIAVLRETAYKAYRIRAFVNQVGAQRKAIILVGESHKKHKGAFAQGERILNEFPYRALEAINASKYWGNKVEAVVLKGCFAAARLLTPRRFECESTIDLAATQTTLEEIKGLLVSLVAATIKLHGLTSEDRSKWADIPAFSFGGEKFSMADVPEWSTSSNGFSITGSEVLELAFKLAASSAESLPTSERTSRIFYLEDDHKPTLAEQIGTFRLPLMAASSAILFANSYLPFGEVPATLQFACRTYMSAVAIGLVAAQALWKRCYDRPWFPYLQGGFSGAFVGARDKTFVRNINAIVQENNDVETLLTIVGRAHVPGVSNILQNQHGWKELDVPGQRVGY